MGIKPVAALAAASVIGLGMVGPANAATTRQAAVDRALSAVDANASKLFSGAGQRFSVKDVIVDSNGASHVRLNRTLRGLPVLGGDLVVHQSAKGSYEGASKTLDRALPASITPSVVKSTAAATADQAGRLQGQVKGALKNLGAPNLVIDARGAAPRLAWLVTTGGTRPDGTPSRIQTTVDALTGKALMSVEQIENDTATGKSLYSGTVSFDDTKSGSTWTLTDPARGGTVTYDAANKTDFCILSLCLSKAPKNVMTDADNVWGSGAVSDRQTVAVDATYGVAKTWDFYKNTFGRLGIANDGKGSYSRVHYGSGYDNAFWDDSCFCMTYGDGSSFGPLVSVDVTGHEMSHGVTSRTAGLTYSGESGGLNEANSDIMGTLVEFYANNPVDPPDYLIGEGPGHGTPLRWMDDPHKDGNSASCWSSTVKNLDVHYSSGVANHFFYLLAVGSGQSQYGNSPTCNGSTVSGIGNAAAGAIWYKALTTYMTSSTNYAGARTATLSAAKDLYGDGSANYNAVAAAWSAVGVS